MEPRNSKLTVILGTNGTGKTTLIKNKWVLPHLKQGKKVLIIEPTDVEFPNIPLVHPVHTHHIETYKYSGARRMIYYETSNREKREGHLNTYELIEKHFTNGLLILDDCRAYTTAATNSVLHNLLISRRQRMLDIIAVAHGFTEMPPKFFTFATEIVLFRTTDNIEKRKGVIQNFELMQQAQKYVNQQAQNNPYFNKVIAQ